MIFSFEFADGNDFPRQKLKEVWRKQRRGTADVIIYRRKSPFSAGFPRELADTIMLRGQVDEDMMDELEEVLITSDIGMDTTLKIMEQLREAVKKEHISRSEDVTLALQRIMTKVVDKGEAQKLCAETPLVILMIGINGGGKTTSIGKLAHKLKKKGKRSCLRQRIRSGLPRQNSSSVWGERNGVNVIRHQEGADPSAVIYDAIQSAKAKEHRCADLRHRGPAAKQKESDE